MPPPVPSASPSGQQVIYPKPKKYIVLCVVAGGGAMLASSAGASGIGLVCLAAIALLWLQFKTSSITLDDQGFTHKSLGRSHTYKWTEINAAEGFCIVTQRVNFIKTNSFVGWKFDSSYRKAKISRAFSGFVLGTEAMIDPLGHNAKELAILMTVFMRRAHARAGVITGVVSTF